MTVYVSRQHAAHRAPRRPWRTALHVAVALLGVTAVGTLGPVLWQMHRDRVQVAAGQATLDQQLEREWNIQTALVAGASESTGLVGRMTIPRLHLSWVLVDNVDEENLKIAPGHFPQTAKPGQRGNASFAGHRSAGVWVDLDEMRAGDPIVIQTKTRFHLYRVTSTLVTLPGAFAQIAPTPPGMTPGKLLTLMTCAPKWDNTHRLWVHAVLERSSKEPPPELTEGDH